MGRFPTGAVFPLLGGNQPSDCFPSATGYQNMLYSHTGISAYAASGSQRDSHHKPQNLEMGRKGHGKHIPAVTGGM